MNTEAATTTTTKSLTPDGLTFKGVDKIDRLKGDYPFEYVTLYTWQCNRMVLRDYNLVSYKMTLMGRNAEVNNKIQKALLDLSEEAEMVHDMAAKYEMPVIDPSQTRSIDNLRVVSPEAQTLIDAILKVDRALFKLSNSELSEVAFDNCSRFVSAYERLKRVVINKRSKSGTSAVSQKPAPATSSEPQLANADPVETELVPPTLYTAKDLEKDERKPLPNVGMVLGGLVIFVFILLAF